MTAVALTSWLIKYSLLNTTQQDTTKLSKSLQFFARFHDIIYCSVTSVSSSVSLTTEGENLVEGIPKYIHEVFSFRKNSELKRPEGLMCKAQNFSSLLRI